jgi:hypothetical protein
MSGRTLVCKLQATTAISISGLGEGQAPGKESWMKNSLVFLPSSAMQAACMLAGRLCC